MYNYNIMCQLVNFLKDKWIPITLLTLLIYVVIDCLFINPHTDYKENFEDITDIKSVLKKNIVISVSNTKQNEQNEQNEYKQYLGVSRCANPKKTPNDCTYHTATLQQTLDDNCVFKIDQVFNSNPPRYRLTSVLSNVVPQMPRMSHKKDIVCFDDGTGRMIEFNVNQYKPNSNLYTIQFNNKYVTIHSINNTSKTDNNCLETKLNLTSDSTKATVFMIEQYEQVKPEDLNIEDVTTSSTSVNTTNLPEQMESVEPFTGTFNESMTLNLL